MKLQSTKPQRKQKYSLWFILKRARVALDRHQIILDNFQNSEANLAFLVAEQEAIEAQKIVDNITEIFSKNEYKDEIIQHIEKERIYFDGPLGNLTFSFIEMSGGQLLVPSRKQRKEDIQLLSNAMQNKASPQYKAARDEFLIIINGYCTVFNEQKQAWNSQGTPEAFKDLRIFGMEILRFKNIPEYKILSAEFLADKEINLAIENLDKELYYLIKCDTAADSAHQDEGLVTMMCGMKNCKESFSFKTEYIEYVTIPNGIQPPLN
jgi:hypothetical protein